MNRPINNEGQECRPGHVTGRAQADGRVNKEGKGGWLWYSWVFSTRVYGALKPVEDILRRGRGKRGDNEGIEPNWGTLNTYMEMSQQTPHTTINTNKYVQNWKWRFGCSVCSLLLGSLWWQGGKICLCVLIGAYINICVMSVQLHVSIVSKTWGYLMFPILTVTFGHSRILHHLSVPSLSDCEKAGTNLPPSFIVHFLYPYMATSELKLFPLKYG
jgi:hypothetical protein